MMVSPGFMTSASAPQTTLYKPTVSLTDSYLSSAVFPSGVNSAAWHWGKKTTGLGSTTALEWLGMLKERHGDQLEEA